MQIGVNGPRGEEGNFRGQEVKGQGPQGRNRSQNPFWQDISRTIRRILPKPGRYILRSMSVVL